MNTISVLSTLHIQRETL